MKLEMKKVAVAVALTVMGGGQAYAAAVGVFDFNAGTGTSNADIGLYSGNGSWMGMNPGTGIVRTNMAPTTIGSLGLDMTITETYTAAAANDFTEANVDDPWFFFFNQGIHFTKGTLPTTELTGAAASIDMTNWYVAWGNDGTGNPIEVPMGFGTDGDPSTPNIGTASSGSDGVWNTGDEFLDWASVVPDGDPSGFGGAPYNLHLEGTFNPAPVIPIPAAAWLFGSALLGLVGVARRKKA